MQLRPLGKLTALRKPASGATRACQLVLYAAPLLYEWTAQDQHHHRHWLHHPIKPYHERHRPRTTTPSISSSEQPRGCALTAMRKSLQVKKAKKSSQLVPDQLKKKHGQNGVMANNINMMISSNCSSSPTPEGFARQGKKHRQAQQQSTEVKAASDNTTAAAGTTAKTSYCSR